MFGFYLIEVRFFQNYSVLRSIALANAVTWLSCVRDIYCDPFSYGIPFLKQLKREAGSLGTSLHDIVAGFMLYATLSTHVFLVYKIFKKMIF